MLDAKHLGSLLLMQNMIVGLPDTVSIYNFVCRGLSFLPGVVSITHTDPGAQTADTKDNVFEYRVVMGKSDYGALRIETVDRETLAAYDPYLKNFAFMISVILEERRQRAENEESRRFLESRVHERTAQLEEALRTREVLLQELFHRTRNSMQLISSLLDIEASYREDTMVKAALRDMKSRVSAIALAHSKLYLRNDLSRIAAADYLQGLVDLVWEGYAELSADIEYTIDVRDDILLLIDTAVPLGIVVVETVSNALKFAFGDRSAGSLVISLQELGTGTLSMTIADDGAGFPQGFDVRRDGRMGLQNVIAIIENQLNGTISVESGPGVRWKLEFWGDLYKPRV